MWARSIGDNATESAGIAPGLIRIVLGLEHPDDLLEDLDRTMALVLPGENAMYCPFLFREDRLAVQHAFIRSHPLGLLISYGSTGLVANLLPFVLKTGDSERGVLQAHMARANPQRREAQLG
jgi:hypothetical protein